jgi:hypothetical protein
MATITLKLQAKTTKAEDDEANLLLAAALCRDTDEITDRFKRPAIKKLLRRGVLKINCSNLDI